MTASTALPAVSLAAHVEYLDAERTALLVAAAQNVPTEIVTSDDGTERIIYGRTAESDAALGELTTAFLPLIHKHARASKVLDFDDALGVCLEEFVSCVRRFDPTSVLPFIAGLSTILARRISDTDRTSDIIQVKENAAARYHQIMHRHGHDLRAAYDECKTQNNGFAPDTFLSVHRAISQTPDSLDISLTDSPGLFDVSPIERYLADAAASPEESTVQADLVQWLFTKVTPKQVQILRLRYGFDDIATANARLAAGFDAARDSLVMSDREVAQVIGSSTPTVNRQRQEALKTMRAALAAADADAAPKVA